MAKQLLFYENVVPVSRERHRDWSVRSGSDYRFARKVNSVPLMAAEFGAAVPEYPIVFTGTADDFIPAVLLGFRDQENLFVDEQGTWKGRYIPAFLRRYPFVFSSRNDGQSFTLCIDESFEGCNREGRGERLFDSEGEQTQYVKNVLGFLQAYQVQFQRTQALCRKLRELAVIEPMQANITLRGGQRMSLGGFFAVSRDKLKALPVETVAELVKSDELELIYLHLVSMHKFSAMIERGQGEPAQQPTAPAPESVEAIGPGTSSTLQ